MTLALALLAQPLATGMVDMGTRPLLTYTTQQSAEVNWSTQPTAEDIAATPAAHVPGGARALRCSADKRGNIIGCELLAAEPDIQDVKASALGLTTLYRLDQQGIKDVEWSRTPPVLWLQIVFPDRRGKVPNDCNPAFNCVVEYMSPPLPPPPPVGKK